MNKHVKFRKIAAMVAAASALSTVFAFSAAADPDIPDYFREHNLPVKPVPPPSLARAATDPWEAFKAKYPNGTFYSTTGKSCDCHSACTYPTSNTATVCVGASSGTCIAYYQAIQCHGFAKNAYEIMNDKKYSYSGNTTKASPLTLSEIKSWKAGTLVRVQTPGEKPIPHTFFVTKAYNASDDTLYIYHCNYGGTGEHCIVKHSIVSKDWLLGAFPNILYKVEP